jgi:hypothetical protein
MFRKKKQNIHDKEEVKMNKEEKLIHESPQICLFDLDESIVEAFAEASYNCSVGSLGRLVRVPNYNRDQQHFLQLNFSQPVNLHEHDILVFNMDFHEEVEYENSKISMDNVTGQSTYALLSTFPERIFNPRAYATHILSEEINGILNKESIVIVFASTEEAVIYQEVEISQSYRNERGSLAKLKNTDFYRGFPSCYNKTGKKMKSPDEKTGITSLLLKHTGNSSYKLVFHHPTHWDNDNKRQKANDNFIPLLLNNDDEIISFFHAYSKGAVFVFPCIKDKKSFLLESAKFS